MPNPSLYSRFLRLERHPVGALAWRLLVCCLLMRPWEWRFQAVDIRLEDLDPDLLALGWWAISRLRVGLARRQGPGPLGTIATLVAVPGLILSLVRVGMPRILDYQSSLTDTVAVWGGWVRHPLLVNF